MANLTDILRIPYPEEYQETWFEVFRDMMSNLDSEIYRNRLPYFLMPPKILFNAETNMVSLLNDLVIVSAGDGHIITVEKGNFFLKEGELVYVDLALPLSEDKVLSFSDLKIAPKLPPDRRIWIMRRGTGEAAIWLFLSNGLLVSSNESLGASLSDIKSTLIMPQNVFAHIEAGGDFSETQTYDTGTRRIARIFTATQDGSTLYLVAKLSTGWPGGEVANQIIGVEGYLNNGSGNAQLVLNLYDTEGSLVYTTTQTDTGDVSIEVAISDLNSPQWSSFSPYTIELQFSADTGDSFALYHIISALH